MVKIKNGKRLKKWADKKYKKWRAKRYWSKQERKAWEREIKEKAKETEKKAYWKVKKEAMIKQARKRGREAARPWPEKVRRTSGKVMSAMGDIGEGFEPIRSSDFDFGIRRSDFDIFGPPPRRKKKRR